MKKVFGFLFVFALLMGASLTSCKGPQGPEGPEGPQGPQGPQGPAGSANVISSSWITPSWQSGSYYGHPDYEYDWTVNDLTQSIMDEGVVLVYWKNWNNEVYSLPKDLEDGDNTFDFYFSLNQIMLLYYRHSSGSVSTPDSSNKFRYVLIPPAGSRPANASSSPAVRYTQLAKQLARQGVDIHNYYQVCEYYGLRP